MVMTMADITLHSQSNHTNHLPTEGNHPAMTPNETNIPPPLILHYTPDTTPTYPSDDSCVDASDLATQEPVSGHPIKPPRTESKKIIRNEIKNNRRVIDMKAKRGIRAADILPLSQVGNDGSNPTGETAEDAPVRMRHAKNSFMSKSCADVTAGLIGGVLSLMPDHLPQQDDYTSTPLSKTFSEAVLRTPEKDKSKPHHLLAPLPLERLPPLFSLSHLPPVDTKKSSPREQHTNHTISGVDSNASQGWTGTNTNTRPVCMGNLLPRTASVNGTVTR
eukprot:TRINITY_DN3371_c1_g1_i5.p1 TRINITY_DN3371_c1_g1~~TRINITY_DN3371_c1_g1_i5.p1  ORF type:complete len:276 (+),score=50.75 TRINITY_DN3371_c1_g1_i5:97-924(+)